MAHKHFVYMIECSDQTIYTGYTTDIDKRLEKHQQGKGAKYTRGRGPLTLKYVETHTSKTTAMQREWAIKQLSKAKKLELMNEKRETIHASSKEL